MRNIFLSFGYAKDGTNKTKKPKRIEIGIYKFLRSLLRAETCIFNIMNRRAHFFSFNTSACNLPTVHEDFSFGMCIYFDMLKIITTQEKRLHLIINISLNRKLTRKIYE